MSEKTQRIRRATRYAALTVGSGIALTFAMSSSAGADEVVVQDAEVTNAGAGFANSGGNVAVGNASENTASSDQTATGLIASNQGTASNTSDGSASVTTGAATATGNASSTQLAQEVDGGSDPGGLTVAVQETDVTNVGVAASNSGGNVAIGNASDNTATNDQTAMGAIASNAGGASNTSDGSADISTGAATATGNASATTVHQAVAADNGVGLAVLVQDSDVLNLGVAVANSGGNLALGNVSSNSATNNQGAFGLIAANNGSATNASNGSATIRTGGAHAAGNTSATTVHQGIDADPAGLAVVVQSAPVVNAGLGIANSGFNFAEGNDSLNQAILAQVSFGLLASNVGEAANWSNGFAAILTGTATAAGNQAITTVHQDS